MKYYILAIDQGTTGTTTILYNNRGEIHAKGYQELTQSYPKPGWVEHDPEEIWKTVTTTLQQALSKGKVKPSQIAAIGITNQRETTILWDRKTGKPLHPAIVWQCRRTAPDCNTLKKLHMQDFFRKKTGLPIDAYFSATKITWLMREVGAVRQAIQKGTAAFGTVDSWLLWKLTNGKSHGSDFTNASRTMLFNIHEKKWDPDILMRLRIPPSLLPTVLPSSFPFGTTEKVPGLMDGIPITGIAGDQQAALFGQTCFEPGESKNTYGTGCFVLVNTGKKVPHSKQLITTLGVNGKGEPIYVVEGSIFIAGAVIQWLRDELKIIKHAKESETLATSIKNNNGVYFVPAFVGLGAPYWDMEARGAITGLTRGSGQAEITRAALESIAYQTKEIVDVLSKETKCSIPRLKVDGGAAQNNFLMQFQADLLQKPVIRPRVIETTSLGAAYLAGLQIGYWKSAGELKKLWQVEKIFYPKMGKKERDTLYKGWRGAVASVLNA